MVAISVSAKKIEHKGYTYADYVKWKDPNRWEIIDGVPYMMAAPEMSHQAISGNIYGEIYAFLKGKNCKVFYAPFDVRLAHSKKDNIVVQPDITVFCDKRKLWRKGAIGAPDLAIEILSPSSKKMDKQIKFKLYKNAGVREYWIVDPRNKTIEVHKFEKDEPPKVYTNSDIIPLNVLQGFDINLADIFAI